MQKLNLTNTKVICDKYINYIKLTQKLSNEMKQNDELKLCWLKIKVKLIYKIKTNQNTFF